MTREEILKEALQCVTGEREQQYGSPISDATTVTSTTAFLALTFIPLAT